LRLVPGIGGGATIGIQTGNATSKFGMTAPELQDALAVARAHAGFLDVAGMHLHIGSPVSGAGDFVTSVGFTAMISPEIGVALDTPLRQLNRGGGYPVDYAHLQPGSNQAGLGSFAAEQDAASMVGIVAAAAARELGTATEIMFEPGRSLVADTALLLTRVE